MLNLCVIPARGGSKAIQRKNIKDLAGKPLLTWSVESALRAHTVGKVVVSTEDEEIAKVATDAGAEVHWRSKENAQDDIHAVHAVLECLNFYKERGITVGSVGMLLATSPLRTHLDIDTAFNILAAGGCDSVVSVSKFDKPVSSLRRLAEDDIMSPIVQVDKYEVQRQEIKELLYVVNGSIFISTAEHLEKTKSFHQGKVRAYKMGKNFSVDINDIADWTMAEALLSSR